MKRILYPIVILGFGAAIMIGLVMTRESPTEIVRENPGVLVKVQTVQSESRTIRVKSHGTVVPRLEVTLSPQIEGRVVWTHPNLVAGGMFRKGERLIQIEPVDFQLAVETSQSAVARAEYDLAVTEGNARIARQEWDVMLRSNRELLMGKPRADADTADPNPLVLYEPQLRNSNANLDAARSRLEQAKLNLARTEIVVPFNGRIREKMVDVGQYLKSGATVATLFGTDVAEVVVPLPLKDLRWFSKPGENTGSGPRVEIALDIGDSRYTWDGWLVRSLGDVDPKGRMARVVVQIIDPFNRRRTWPDGQPELSMGLFVQVGIIGRTIERTIPIPRSALHPENFVWLCDDNNRLEIRKVSVLRMDAEEALIQEGLRDGDRVVLSSLGGAAPGMKLRLLPQEGRP